MGERGVGFGEEGSWAVGDSTEASACPSVIVRLGWLFQIVLSRGEAVP